MSIGVFSNGDLLSAIRAKINAVIQIIDGTNPASDIAVPLANVVGAGTAAGVNTGTGDANVPTITQADARYRTITSADALYARLDGATFTGDVQVTSASPDLILNKTGAGAASHTFSGNTLSGSMIINIDSGNAQSGSVLIINIDDSPAMRIEPAGSSITDGLTGLNATKADNRYGGLAIQNAWALSQLVGRSSTALGVPGIINFNNGNIRAEAIGLPLLDTNRLSTDGELVRFYKDSVQQGSIVVNGTTVTYASFSGAHWSQLADNSKTTILRGTILETIDAMCIWAQESNDQLAKVQICDSIGSKRVYGVFMSWDEDDLVNNDMNVCGLGAYVIRMASGETPAGGDLLESAGGGCARVQTDTVIASSTIGKVTSPHVVETYEDGSFLVPCVLYCG